MFWDKIRNEMLKYGEIKEWRVDYKVLPNHDNICGIRLYDKNDNDIISIISHKGSYGSDEQFETMPPIHINGGYGDVEGYLSEDDILSSLEGFVRRETNNEYTDSELSTIALELMQCDKDELINNWRNYSIS